MLGFCFIFGRFLVGIGRASIMMYLISLFSGGGPALGGALPVVSGAGLYQGGALPVGEGGEEVRSFGLVLEVNKPRR